MIGVPYFRFNPQMSVDIAMDEKLDVPVKIHLFLYFWRKNNNFFLSADQPHVGNQGLYVSKPQ